MKAHVNGIKKVKDYPAKSLKGVSVAYDLLILHDVNNILLLLDGPQIFEKSSFLQEA